MASIQHHPWCDEAECYLGPDGRIVHVGHDSVIDAWPVVVGVALTDAGDGLQVRLSIDSGITSKAARLCPEDAVALAESLIRYADCAEGRCAPAI